MPILFPITKEFRKVAENIMKKLGQHTSSAFAVDMRLKFIQGLPVVGIIGGAANPIYIQQGYDVCAT